MKQTDLAMKQTWEASFEEAIQLQAYNTAPVEALIRSLSYYLRDRFKPSELNRLHFLEMGCGAGPNLLWLARKGIQVSGVDISPTALKLTKSTLTNGGCSNQIGQLVEGSVTQVPFKDQAFDGIIEACVFQHLAKEDRLHAFEEVRRLLKPGGIFVGYMLDSRHSVFQNQQKRQLPDDSGTLDLRDGSSKIHLTNIGLSHFFTKEEVENYFKGFSLVDPCWTSYYLPKVEAEKRGYPEYLQSMFTVYAIK
jgi:ubiquinone/menaquinone biosynthesis C-methylase UbiE